MIKRYALFLSISIIILSSFQSFASPQLPDYIIFKGDTIATFNLILELYFQKQEKAEQGNPFGLSFRDGASLNCWRGYQAIYKIENDSLFLVYIIYCGERLSGKINIAASAKKIKDIFGNKVINSRVYINWFSGDINFPLNNKLLRWDGVFYKIFEKETVINVFNGKVLKTKEVENYIDSPKSINRKDKNKVSDILFKELKKVKWKSIDKFDCSEKYLVTIDEKGIVSRVTMLEYQAQDSIDKYWDRDEYDYCISTILTGLKKLKFDIIKDKGKPISEDIYIEIWFDEKKGKLENWTH